MSLREKVERSLSSMAESVVPEGTTPTAVLDQWTMALQTKTELFGDVNGALSEKIFQKLNDDGVLIPDLTTELLDGGKNFTFIDLFAGIGGMHLGFKAHGGQCVFASEFEKNAQKTYAENHRMFPFGDITKIDEEAIPAHDVLIAGFPCQPFSHAGKKLGIEDTRGTLFHDIARILKAKRPKFALLENVRGLVSHDRGYTLEVILKTLMSIGYKSILSTELVESGDTARIQAEAKKMILKSVDFGVPQNRQRIYIVLWREDLDIEDFVYPTPPKLETSVGKILEKDPDPKLTISDRLWEGHQRRKLQNRLNGKGFGYGLVTEDSPYTNTISARYYKDGSEILVSQGDGRNPRKLSPREAARIQGFPEWFKINPSNTQAYKQFGNSVSVPVISALAQQIVRYL
ncbi:MAG: DNA cytosine methyltransferase [Corynebacterium sp.]|uniref:DNA cytosine methyltransferase n=1 Tax=Corynebacterium sp. TaxID=1720 RepID=UPI0026DD7CB5|nr:DNA cytosine methyltransferase [Corynebacterium sp.]MDO4762220.1 DNA cytosine methyltransferase [Corynebacterium sp.]